MGAHPVNNAWHAARTATVQAGFFLPLLKPDMRLLDRGWSVLIFPEGQLTVDGPVQPFKTGIGLLAVEAGLPVAPVRIREEQKSLVQGRWWPPRGAYTVTIGELLTFPPGTPYAEATAQIEAAVRAL